MKGLDIVYWNYSIILLPVNNYACTPDAQYSLSLFHKKVILPFHPLHFT